MAHILTVKCGANYMHTSNLYVIQQVAYSTGEAQKCIVNRCRDDDRILADDHDESSL